MLFNGCSYDDDYVSISAPQLAEVRAALKLSDISEIAEKWAAKAQQQDDIIYFSIRWEEELVGQIFLHDIDEVKGEGLVGYHLFEEKHRGRGVGTIALGLLQEYVREETGLTRLVVITAAENTRSCRIAEKRGFKDVGVSRENANLVVYHWESRQ